MSWNKHNAMMVARLRQKDNPRCQDCGWRLCTCKRTLDEFEPGRKKKQLCKKCGCAFWDVGSREHCDMCLHLMENEDEE